MRGNSIVIKSATSQDVTQIKGDLSFKGVTVFRKAFLNNEEFCNFLIKFGSLMFTEGERPLPDYPMLNAVTNVKRKVAPRSVYHTDTSYVLRPPAYTALRAVHVPESGGATLFTDQFAVAESLPPRCRSFLLGKTIQHGVTGLEDIDNSARHPLLRKHPISGKAALYLSTPERCSDLEGCDLTHSVRIIDLLYRYSQKPRFIYRHQWQPGDVVMWDNRCTMHCADHRRVIGDRVLHRGMVEGELPIAVTSDYAPFK